MKKALPRFFIELLHWTHYLSWPFALAAVYFMYQSVSSSGAGIERNQFGVSLIFLGFFIAIYSLKKSAPVPSSQSGKIRSQAIFLSSSTILFWVMTALVIFKKGFQDSISIGLCSIGIGLLAFAKAVVEQYEEGQRRAADER